MRYVSTRGEAPELGFEDVLLTGLALDGGLYLPSHWPQLGADQLRALRGKSYAEIACAVIAPYTAGAIPDAGLQRMLKLAYADFGHPAVAPLTQLGPNHFLLELFHGPTLAFKDVAMQLLAPMMDWALARRGTRATIVGATSGDTGGAAIEAFKASQHASTFILHPHGRVSEVQRRQMTTVQSAAIHNIALEGTFDDAQAIVKALFNDHAFRARTGLSGVNSINWARILAQIVYYVSSALSLGSPDRPVRFTVPTGNFGDVFAGYAAMCMGLPVERLIIATNSNDILHRALSTGRYEITGVTPSSSPSMDIQVSSNFERLLYAASGRDPHAVRAMMAGLSQSGAFTIPPAALAAIRAQFSSGAAPEAEVATAIRRTLQDTGELLDPHSAVAVCVAQAQPESAAPMITLATAHPAKFPDAVEKACAIRPALPHRLQGLLSAPERYTVLPNSIDAVKTFILNRTPS